MNLDRLYSIFNKTSLTRKDIEMYNTTANSVEKNAIEQKASSNAFDQDALEGWGGSDASINDMNVLDKRFLNSKPSYLWQTIGISSGIVLIVLSVFIFIEPNSEDDKIQTSNPSVINVTQQDMVVEETDLMLPESIKQMKIAPTKNQQQPQVMKDEFAKMNSEKEPESITEEVHTLPVKPIEEKKATIVKNRTDGKEIYLNDLKLIDYRIYRSKPTVKTKQVLLTGTPANKEEKTSEEIEATWQVVDIPYLDYLDKSLRIFNNENYKKALSRFETILVTYPDDVNAYFYGGLCLYNLGEYSTAIEHFEICINGKFLNFDEEALWMIGQSYDLLGKKLSAKNTYEEIIRANGFYAEQAKAKLNE